MKKSHHRKRNRCFLESMTYYNNKEKKLVNKCKIHHGAIQMCLCGLGKWVGKKEAKVETKVTVMTNLCFSFILARAINQSKHARSNVVHTLYVHNSMFREWNVQHNFCPILSTINVVNSFIELLNPLYDADSGHAAVNVNNVPILELACQIPMKFYSPFS